jgi:PBSX family phage terminase large subunit
MPKQAEFVASEKSEILYSGAFGAGKTRALCYRALRKASEHPAVKFGLCRKTMVSLKMTTMRTLLEADGDLPPVLLPGTYQYHKVPGEQRIRLHGGGEIIPFGCDDPQKVGSLQLTDCGIDECVELDKDEWDMLLGRVRVRYTRPDGTDNHRTLAGVCNPGDPGHFLHDIFFKQGGDDRHLIQTSAVENWYLPSDYVPKLTRTLFGAALERYVFGKWAISEGAVYPMLQPAIHWVHRPGPWLRYIGGVDYGFVNPMVLRVHGVDGDGCSHVVAELYRTGVTSDGFAEICKVTSEHYSPIVFAVDPSAAELIMTMRRKNLSVVSANNDVLGGINAVQNMLMVDPDTKRPRLTMEPSCKQGNMEYLGYRWNDHKSKDEPVKRNDHAADADRYAVMYNRNPKRGRRLRSLQLVPSIPRIRPSMWADVPIWN